MEDSIHIEDFENLNNGESDVEEVPLTAAEVIELMEEAWRNEKFAPEMLPQKSEVVDCLLGQISYMEENLRNLKSTDFQKSIHQLEVDRLRFLVNSYLRQRLQKIEAYVFVILKQEEQRLERNEDLYLTNSELEFAKNYKESIEQHFDEILGFWPGLPSDEWKNDPVTPNINSFVFLKSKNEIEGVVIDDGTEEEEDLVDFKIGSQLIISYNSVSNLVKNGE
ncbi:hypothetical protein AMK59_8390, partial [Oryctes borbonicus]